MKMSVDEFKRRFGEGGNDQMIAVIADGRVVGHYIPATPENTGELDLEAWADARTRFRRRWIERTPDWKERLARYGLDEDGEPFHAEEPRFPA
jgi:hypothetical protein